ncbi:MAG: hypothetical protein KDD62_11510 [Bdellovibrionales bacterium]|nr:hypothetical protein [Bdellovibrionales bacterium]
MLNFDAHQAQLLRLLSEFFGDTNVIPQMSLAAVFADCNEAAQEKLAAIALARTPDWSRTEKCLFTIVDTDGTPKLIVELFADDGNTVDLLLLDKQEQLEVLCREAQIHLAIFGYHELAQILDPSSGMSLLSCLSGKVLPRTTIPAGFGS